MSYGKMNSFINLVSTTPTKDAEGFTTKGDTILASVRAYKEERHGSVKWANMAAFSEATALFRFRKIPTVEVRTDMLISCDGNRYNIVSVEDVKGRGMYIEALCEEVKPSGKM